MHRIWQSILQQLFRKPPQPPPYPEHVQHEPVFVENYSDQHLDLMVYWLEIGRRQRGIYLLGFPETLAGPLVWKLAQTSPFLDLPRETRQIDTTIYYLYKASRMLSKEQPIPYEELERTTQETITALKTCYSILNELPSP